MIEIAIGAIIVALIFDFVNGFNDSANSVATVIGTRVLRPIHAVAISAVANFVGPFIFGVAVFFFDHVGNSPTKAEISSASDWFFRLSFILFL